MNYAEFFELLQMFIIWQGNFTKDDMEVIENSGLFKLAIHYASSSTDLNNKLGVILSKLPSSRTRFPELTHACIDNVLKSENIIHTNTLHYISESFFAVKSVIDKDKGDEFLSLLSSSLLRDFEFLPGKYSK